MPTSEVATVESVRKYENLLLSIQKPVSDEEACALVTVFGNDDCFGLAWSLLHLIETAPNWPLQDCLANTENDWVDLLRLRLANAQRRVEK